MSMLENGNLISLLASWWGHSQWQVRHLARNVRLDCPGLTSPDHPNCGDCGGRLSPEAVSLLNDRAGDMMDRLLSEELKGERIGRSWDQTWDYARRELAEIGANARKDLFGDTPLTPPSVDADRIEVTRYVDCRAIYHHWLGHKQSEGNTRDVQRACLRALVRPPGSWTNYKGQPATLAAGNSMVWVTHGSPPHRQREVTALPEADRAEHVARLMGLPGYDYPEDRQEKVGLMAISYEIVQGDLRAPRIFDALDNPYFFPGYRSEPHGRVASLEPDFSSPWNRTPENSTVPEWVHHNGTVREVQPKIEVVSLLWPKIEIVGFFEDDFEDAGAVR